MYDLVVPSLDWFRTGEILLFPFPVVAPLDAKIVICVGVCHVLFHRDVSIPEKEARRMNSDGVIAAASTRPRRSTWVSAIISLAAQAPSSV